MITLNELKEFVSYDPITGEFTCLNVRQGIRVKIGETIGTMKPSGYMAMYINGREYSLHRLAWFYTYGEMPNVIDHQDGDPSNNAISNLRNTDIQGNGRNRKKNADNTSGVTGVVWHKRGKRWFGQIKVDGKKIHLGSFIEFSDAVNARKNAEVLYGFHENHGREG